MALGPRLDLRQSQQLVMTPQLQQAIKLLALTNLEIEAFVTEELERNPLLEVQSEDERERDGDEPDRSGDEPDRGGQDGETAGEGFDDEPVTADRLIETGDGASDGPLDVDYGEEVFHHDSASDSGSYGLDGGLSLDGGGTGGGVAREEGSESMAGANLSLPDPFTTPAGAPPKGPDITNAAPATQQAH